MVHVTMGSIDEPLEPLTSVKRALRRDIEALGHLAATAEGVSEESLDC